MSTAVIARIYTAEAATQSRPTPERMTWILGRLRYTEEAGVPIPTKRWVWLKRLWYGKAHQPRVSIDEPGKEIIPDFRQAYGSRALAESYCLDKDDFIVALGYNGVPLGDEIFRDKTFCRPRHSQYREQNLDDRSRYTADLNLQIADEMKEREERIMKEARRLRQTIDNE